MEGRQTWEGRSVPTIPRGITAPTPTNTQALGKSPPRKCHLEDSPAPPQPPTPTPAPGLKGGCHLGIRPGHRQGHWASFRNTDLSSQSLRSAAPILLSPFPTRGPLGPGGFRGPYQGAAASWRGQGGHSPGWDCGISRRPPAPGRRTPGRSTGSPGRRGHCQAVPPDGHLEAAPGPSCTGREAKGETSGCRHTVPSPSVSFGELLLILARGGPSVAEPRPPTPREGAAPRMVETPARGLPPGAGAERSGDPGEDTSPSEEVSGAERLQGCPGTGVGVGGFCRPLCFCTFLEHASG